MYLPPPVMIVAFFGLSLQPGLEGHILAMDNPEEIDQRTHHSTSDFNHDALRSLLRSLTPNPSQFQLPQKGVSCQDLMPEALGDFATVPRNAQRLIQASLSLALQSAGCPLHAEALVHQLSKELGEASTESLLRTMAGALSTPKPLHENNSSVALQFNLDQLAPKQAWRCRSLRRVNGALLQGQVYSDHMDFLTATIACQRLGDSCAGVAPNGTGSFHVVVRDGSFFLPHHGGHSWLHQCHSVGRVRRSSSKDCVSKKEQKVHAVLEWIPVAGTYYNLGSSIYFATRGCIEMAKVRALDGAIDLGYDVMVAMIGGAGGVVSKVVSILLHPLFKKGVHSFINYFHQVKQQPYSNPSNYSSPADKF